MNQAIHDFFRGLYFTYCLGGFAILIRVLVRIELRGAIVELARKDENGLELLVL